MNNELYFSADDGVNGKELWKSDGTATGTVMVKDINGSGNFSPVYLTFMNNKIYFSADDGVNGYELWKSDGTAIGTVMVKDINGPGHSSPGSLTVMNNEIYFSADDGINGIEPWRTYIITSPIVVSGSSVSVSQATATLSGEIQSIGRQNNFERGFVYSSVTVSPTINDNKESQTGSFGAGSFSATISDLNCASTYYFRAYSINRAGISYGEAISFTTSACSLGRAFLPPETFLSPEKPQETLEVSVNRGSEQIKKKIVIDDFKIIINNGAKETYSREVDLELITGTNTVDMAISENSDFEKISLEPYQRNRKYILSDNEGEKTIYVKFYTKWGQSSKIASSSIVYKKVSEIDKNEEDKKEAKEIKKEPFFDISKFLGRIIFQTENKNKAWYINPVDQKKYSVENPFRMFNVMSYLSLGAVHEYINKYLEFPQRALGRILLDVEKNGEAYYINPIDRKKYYLGRPEDAFGIMKGFSMGISDSDIEKIETGEVEIKD